MVSSVSKMNQIACCDWLPKRARCSYLACLGLPAMFCEKNFPKSQIINPLVTKLLSIKIARYWPCFFCEFIWTLTPSQSINIHKKNLANIRPSWPRAWSITHIHIDTAHNSTHFLHMHLCNSLSDCLFLKVMKPFNLCRQAWHQVILFSLLWWWVQHQVELCFLSHRPWPWQNFLVALCRLFQREAHLKVM